MSKYSHPTKTGRTTLSVLLVFALMVAPFGAFAASAAPTAPVEPAAAADAVAAPIEPGIWEYAPPAPWANIPADELADHALSYVPRRTALNTPNAFNFKIGNHKALVVLAEFSDVAHRAGGTQSYYDSQMNANGSGQRSARSYFYENSYGNYTLTTTVTTWVTLPHTQAYYGQGAGIYDLVGDAAKAANAQVDFTQFDENSDGYVDNMVILHSGGDEAAGCGAQCVWAHSGAGYAVKVDGKWAQAYCTVGEFWSTGMSSGDALGVLVHEFGHLSFDLPDLYDRFYNNDGTGSWDLMSGGSWAGGGTTPTHFSAWSKLDLGWIDPYVPTGNIDPYTIYPTNDVLRHNTVKIETNYTNEYFLLEFRSESGGGLFDVALPRDGLLIQHIDSNTIASTRFNNAVQGTTSHKGVDIEEVGNQDLDNVNVGDTFPSNDVWVSNAAGFTPTSSPNTNLYQNGGAYQTGIKVYNISAVLSGGGPHMTFTLDSGRVNFGISARIIGGPAEQSVLPGAAASFTVQVTTFASSGDTATLTLEGVSAGLASINPNVLSLGAFGSATATLTVNIPGDWSAGDIAQVQVRASSASSPGNNALASTITRALQVYNVDALNTGALTKVQEPDTTVSTEITVRNLGNGADNVTLSTAYDPAQILVSISSPNQIMVRGAFTAVLIDVTVHPTVLEGTLIPVVLDIRYGPSSASLHRYYYANVTAGRLQRIGLELLAVSPVNLDPGGAEVLMLTVHNNGNYLATIHFTAMAPVGFTILFDVGTVQVPAFGQQTIGATVQTDPDAPARSTGTIYFEARLADGGAPAQAQFDYYVKQRYQLTLGGDSAATALPGSKVIFNLVAVNLGNGMDNTTVQVVPAFSEWNASLSAVNVTLTATPTGRAVSIFLTVTVPPNAGGNLLQEFTVTLTSQNNSVVATRRVTALVLPVYSFNVTVEAAQGPIGNTEKATFLVNFRNTGNVRDSYSVTVSGLPEGWSHEFVEGGVATILPRFTGLMTLVISPPTSARADTYDFQVYASSEGDLAQRKIVLQHVTISPHREIKLETTSVDGEVRPGATVTVHLIVRNLGNVQEGLVFESPGNSFKSVDFDPFQLNIPAYHEAVATVVVVLNDDQASGYAPLVVSVSSISNSSVGAEETVGINVAKATPSTTTVPGADALLVGAALGAAAVANLVLSRRRPE